jgi:hypothetical protein
MTSVRRLVFASVALVVAAACTDAARPTSPRSPDIVAGVAAAPNESAVDALATGGGHYLLAGVYDVQFAFTARQKGDGSASGEFHVVTLFEAGTFDITADVVCVSVDDVNGRAWIGGRVRRNDSTDPDYIDPITAPGADIWFRVLDSGEGSGAVDRSTFTGFRGSAGFLTSQDYCNGGPWPADNARTNPVTEGNIQVHR